MHKFIKYIRNNLDVGTTKYQEKKQNKKQQQHINNIFI
jgi:hypothetical protein